MSRGVRRFEVETRIVLYKRLHVREMREFRNGQIADKINQFYNNHDLFSALDQVYIRHLKQCQYNNI